METAYTWSMEGKAKSPYTPFGFDCLDDAIDMIAEAKADGGDARAILMRVLIATHLDSNLAVINATLEAVVREDRQRDRLRALCYQYAGQLSNLNMPAIAQITGTSLQNVSATVNRLQDKLALQRRESQSTKDARHKLREAWSKRTDRERRRQVHALNQARMNQAQANQAGGQRISTKPRRPRDAKP